MQKEQNIDDILKLLKDSVNTDATSDGAEGMADSTEDISTESLQEQLKNQYVFGADPIETDTSESEYVLDSDFLTSALKDSPAAAPVAVLAEETEEIAEEIKEAEEVDEPAEMPPIFEKAFEPEESDDGEPLALDEPEIVMQPLFMSELTPSRTEEITESAAEESADEATEEMPVEEEAPAEPDTPKEPHETFLASMRKIGVDFTTDSMYNADKAAEDTHYMEELSDTEVIEEELPTEEVDPSTINIMLQFCDKDELDKTVGSKKVDDFIKAEHRESTAVHTESIKKEAESSTASDSEQIMGSLLAKRKSLWLSAAVCAVLAFITLIYELLPMLGAELAGIFDYSEYPAVYVLFGLQLLVLCAALRYRECWNGLKCAFSDEPSRDSLCALVAILTAIYDLTAMLIIAFADTDLPNLYNASAVLLLLVCAVMDCLELRAKIKALEVYSCDTKKFTFIKQGAEGSIAGKMYAGGLEQDRSVYIASEVSDTHTFTTELLKRSDKSRFMSLYIIPLLVLGMLSSLVSIFIGADAYVACASFMVCIYLLLPTAFVLCDGMAYIIAAERLAGRGSALAGKEAAEYYGDMDIAVFNDLHMFKKCKTEDIGIVIYDAKVGYLVLGCLDALYKKIGGPMSGMNIDLPEVFTFGNASIRRVARNGIEALVDRRHSLIVGETEFMKRYGLDFPPNETDNGRSTLCVALNGRVAAKLSVKYTAEPAFEMLVERMAKEGIACAVQTFDPLISSALAARTRTLGHSPISVIHKGVGEVFELADNSHERRDMLVSCTSRAKLAEAAVWLKRVSACKKICRLVGFGISALGVAAMALLLAFGGITYINQAVLVTYMLLQGAGMCALYILMLPSRKYFTVEQMYAELEQKYVKQLAQEQKKTEKKEKTNNE